jgi:hypothetical protein
MAVRKEHNKKINQLKLGDAKELRTQMEQNNQGTSKKYFSLCRQISILEEQA